MLLVERQEPPLRKVCGEFLSAGGLDLWMSLTGRAPPASSPEIRTVRFLTRARRGPLLRLDPPARGLTRTLLDGALLDAAAAAGATVRTGASVQSWCRDGASFRAGIRSAGAEGPEIAVGQVVLSTGRSLERIARGKWWIGRKATAHGAQVEADLEMLLLDGGGYSGVSRVETGAHRVSALVHGAGDGWLRHPALDGARVEVGQSVARFRLGLGGHCDDGALRVGDALAVWPPLVGDGITVAMASGILLAEALARRLAEGSLLTGGEWARVWRGTFARKLRLALALHHVADSRAARGAFLSLLGVFPAVGQWLARATRSRPRGVPLRALDLSPEDRAGSP